MKNYTEIRLHAHTIKGAAANLSASRLQHCASVIESSILKGDAQQIIEQHIRDLSHIWGETFNIFEKHLKDNNKKSTILLDRSEVIAILEALKVAIENGDFIDTQNMDIFSLDSTQEIISTLERLKNSINNFSFDKALEILDDLLVEYRLMDGEKNI